jgi:pimeloyl-ACP methyl ester carboxylesterase
MTRVFIHGLESSSQGIKGVFFRERYPDMIIEDFTGPLEERMKILNRLLADKTDLILVGSSFGGLMAAIYACQNEDKVQRLIMLAPALILYSFASCLERKIEIPAFIYHGSRDTVVPPGPVRDLAGRVFSNLKYHLVEDDHSLHVTFPRIDWDHLLAL